MKSKYQIEARGDAEGQTLALVLHCTQYQIRRVFIAMAYAMATEGGWRFLAVKLGGKSVYTTEIGVRA